MNPWYWRLTIPVSLFGVLYAVRLHAVNAHTVEYRVSASGQKRNSYVVIKYLDTAHFGGYHEWDLRSVRVLGSALPWSTTVSLPTDAVAKVAVATESPTNCRFTTAIVVDGGAITEGPGKPDEPLDESTILWPKAAR